MSVSLRALMLAFVAGGTFVLLVIRAEMWWTNRRGK